MQIDQKRIETLVQKLRVLLPAFDKTFDKTRLALISSPGRTEVGGNHTDHQHGNVLAAAINRDVLVLASANDDFTINLETAEFGMQSVSFGADFGKTRAIDGLAPRSEDTQTEKLIRGVVSFLHREGYAVGGFDASSTSEVLIGSGLSSSAAFENAIGQTINHLYNSGKIPATVIARAGQFAENEYLGKGSGLMDQTASAIGGFVQIDFKDPVNPVITPVEFDFAQSGYSLCVTDTKGSHASLDDAYSAMPNEMKAVAKYFGEEFLADVDESEFWERIGELKATAKKTAPDASAREIAGESTPKITPEINHRAILRAIHFFAETRRAVLEAKLLQAGEFDTFLQVVQESGNSSLAYLQNVWNETLKQNVTLGLALSQKVLQPAGQKPEGAWRVHGGGFAGTIQAFVPNALVDEYRATLDTFFGAGSCEVLAVRSEGAIRVDTANLDLGA